MHRRAAEEQQDRVKESGEQPYKTADGNAAAGQQDHWTTTRKQHAIETIMRQPSSMRRVRTAMLAATVATAVQLAGLLPAAAAINFPYEAVQLTDADVGNFSAVAFGNATAAAAAAAAEEGSNTTTTRPCRAFPGTPDWPSAAEWTRLNATLDGALLHPEPPGAVCYAGAAGVGVYDEAQCRRLVLGSMDSRVYIDDPLTVLTAWPQGQTCAATLQPGQRRCTRGGFPTYVVNATTARHVQAAVNFARNRHVRLVVKNTGHDFVGRSTGAGALSVWTHHLKSFAFEANYSAAASGYRGPAARVGAGLEAWELFAHMDRHNVTLVVPGGQTVGAYGGWTTGGGHAALSSAYGLGADQVLELQVVTADGRFHHVDPRSNPDLFYALRGGGPGTYAIVTSAVVRAFPAVHVSETSLAFQVGNPWAALNLTGFNFTAPNATDNPFAFANATANVTLPLAAPNASAVPGLFGDAAPAVAPSVDVFWQAVAAYYRFGQRLCDGGGTAYSYLSRLGLPLPGTPAANATADGDSYSFSTTLELPDMDADAAQAFVQPLFDRLAALGIRVNNTRPHTSVSWSAGIQHGDGDSPGNMRFGSRLFPRAAWDSDAAFADVMAALRTIVERGYNFHGVQVAPARTLPAVQFPGGSAVNPAFRDTLMHGDVFDYSGFGGDYDAGGFGGFGSGSGPGLNATQVRLAERARFEDAMDLLRNATPGSGAYVNEADPDEPAWQQSFWGDQYARLLAVKHARDPWGLFWAPTTVGSEPWSVRTPNNQFEGSQNGRLCLVTAPPGAEVADLPGHAWVASMRRAFTGPRHQ